MLEWMISALLEVVGSKQALEINSCVFFLALVQLLCCFFVQHTVCVRWAVCVTVYRRPSTYE